MPPDDYTVFICYRGFARAFAEEVLHVLRDAGVEAEMDHDYDNVPISHHLQSLERIQTSDCVIIVLPADLSWLPADLGQFREIVVPIETAGAGQKSTT